MAGVLIWSQEDQAIVDRLTGGQQLELCSLNVIAAGFQVKKTLTDLSNRQISHIVWGIQTGNAKLKEESNRRR